MNVKLEWLLFSHTSLSMAMAYSICSVPQAIEAAFYLTNDGIYA
jgi:hypothetical protein